ncbi:MAG: hypothetical protein DRO65_01685 [Candidatus Altiarchaeales archaeon]|nr:MAG: hypothetical protein DRO65_01685 [Candidatus Altiarchaeales archaeon]
MLTTSEVKLREFRVEDSKDIVRLHYESKDAFEAFPIDEDTIINIAKREDFLFIVAEINNKVVGFVGALFQRYFRRAEIGPICISKPWRRKGIGTLLINEIMRRLKIVGIVRVISRVKSNNLAAINFFKKNGFVEEGFFKKYTRDGEDVIQFVKFI